MKKYCLIMIVVLFLLSCNNERERTVKKENELNITGLWGLYDVKNMSKFLSLTNLRTMNYLIKIEKNQVDGFVYFNYIQNPIKIKIIHVNKERFAVEYKTKRRFFIIRFEDDVKEWYWHFDDSCKHPPDNKYNYCNDGVLENRDIINLNDALKSMKEYDRSCFETGNGGQEPAEVVQQLQDK